MRGKIEGGSTEKGIGIVTEIVIGTEVIEIVIENVRRIVIMIVLIVTEIRDEETETEIVNVTVDVRINHVLVRNATKRSERSLLLPAYRGTLRKGGL